MPRLLPILLPLALGCCGCRGGEASSTNLLHGTIQRGGGPDHLVSNVRLEADEHGRWWSYGLRREDFVPAGIPGIWRAARAAAGVGQPEDGSPPVVLLAGGERRPGIEVGAAAKMVDALPDGAFAVAGDAVFLRADDQALLPEACEVREFLRGAGASEAGRIRVAGFSGDGAILLPGDAFEAAVPAGPEPAAFRAWTACAGALAGQATPLAFRVLLGGEELAVLEERVGERPSATARSVPLPAGAAGRVLRIEVRGPAAVGGLFAPRIGPADPAAAGDARPDVVLFLAGAYRADNLACYGGDPRIAPHLDRLAEESLRFLRTWSPASWTLPSHAALFSGLHPYQSTVVSGSSALPEKIETLAERFAAGGYRCGAVTDAGCVSASYGLDQGFEWFDEEWGAPERTLAAVERFLAGDDGRPQLFFVQSYRAHWPYAAGPEAAAQVGGPAAGAERARALRARLEAEAAGTARDDLAPDLRAAAQELEALYRGAAAELDRLLGELRELLERRGLAGAYLIVTSDHGEAFLEHGLLGHGNGTYEELTRVPLLIHGPGVTPGDRLDAASLVQLPVTLAAIAGVAPSPGWGGRSLLAAPADDPPAFAFECDWLLGPSTVSVVDGALKMIAPLDAGDGVDLSPAEVFDLDADPGERANLREAGDAWRARWQAREAALEGLLAPRARSAEARLTDAERGVLEALGCAGY